MIKGQTEVKLTSDMLGSSPQFSVAVLINGIDYYNNQTNLTTFTVQFSVSNASHPSVALFDTEKMMYGCLIGVCVFLLLIVRRGKTQTPGDKKAESPSLLRHH